MMWRPGALGVDQIWVVVLGWWDLDARVVGKWWGWSEMGAYPPIAGRGREKERGGERMQGGGCRVSSDADDGM